MSDTAVSEGFNAASDAEYVDPTTGEVLDSAPEKVKGELVVRDAIERLQSGKSDVFTTVTGTDFASKVKVLTAVTAAQAIGQAIDDAGKGGLHISLDNVVVQAVKIHDRDNNGNRLESQSVVPRVILIAKDGTAYYGFSPTLLNAVGTFIGTLGHPSGWPQEGVPTQITREKASLGTFFNMVYDVNPPKK